LVQLVPVVLGGVWAGPPAEAPELEQVEHVDPRHQRPALLLAARQQSSVQTLHQLLVTGLQLRSADPEVGSESLQLADQLLPTAGAGGEAPGDGLHSGGEESGPSSG